MTDAITFRLDRREVEAPAGETIWQVLSSGIARSRAQEQAEDARWR
jgi:hypothetical protein